MAECDKEGQPDHSARMRRRIMVGTTHAQHMQQLERRTYYALAQKKSIQRTYQLVQRFQE